MWTSARPSPSPSRCLSDCRRGGWGLADRQCLRLISVRVSICQKVKCCDLKLKPIHSSCATKSLLRCAAAVCRDAVRMSWRGRGLDDEEKSAENIRRVGVSFLFLFQKLFSRRWCKQAFIKSCFQTELESGFPPRQIAPGSQGADCGVGGWRFSNPPFN